MQRRKKFYVLLLLQINYLASCSFIPERSYSDLMQEENDIYVPDRDFAISAGDTGHRYESLSSTIARTPASLDGHEFDTSLSADLKEKYQLEYELASLEQRQPPLFQDMYLQYKDYFSNDSERIYFLTLPSLKDREQYLLIRGMKSSEQRPKYLSELISKEDHREILTGMSPIQVRKLAGNPSYIEAASSDGSSRWAYKLPNYRVRYIYFNQGGVNGWSEEVSP